MELIRMEKEHCEILAELEKLCFPHPWSQKSLEDETLNPCAYFITAVDEEKILGYGGMHCSHHECYVDNIAVFGHHRKKGVGTAIVEELIREAQRRDAEFISLEVRPSNRAAVSLYTRLGFLEEGRRRNFYTDPTEDALILTRRFKKEDKS
jgi:ribosomal-protein-alanine N-acetyltransferase